MPIEIKELLIKINVNDEGQTNASPDKSSGSKSTDLIEQCIEQITEIQQRKNER